VTGRVVVDDIAQVLVFLEEATRTGCEHRLGRRTRAEDGGLVFTCESCGFTMSATERTMERILAAARTRPKTRG
jgi:hypothetical protein